MLPKSFTTTMLIADNLGAGDPCRPPTRPWWRASHGSACGSSGVPTAAHQQLFACCFNVARPAPRQDFRVCILLVEGAGVEDHPPIGSRRWPGRRSPTSPTGMVGSLAAAAGTDRSKFRDHPADGEALLGADGEPVDLGADARRGDERLFASPCRGSARSLARGRRTVPSANVVGRVEAQVALEVFRGSP